jgi:hypothetical protein
MVTWLPSGHVKQRKNRFNRAKNRGDFNRLGLLKIDL